MFLLLLLLLDLNPENKDRVKILKILFTSISSAALLVIIGASLDLGFRWSFLLNSVAIFLSLGVAFVGFVNHKHKYGKIFSSLGSIAPIMSLTSLILYFSLVGKSRQEVYRIETPKSAYHTISFEQNSCESNLLQGEFWSDSFTDQDWFPPYFFGIVSYAQVDSGNLIINTKAVGTAWTGLYTLSGKVPLEVKTSVNCLSDECSAMFNKQGSSSGIDDIIEALIDVKSTLQGNFLSFDVMTGGALVSKGVLGVSSGIQGMWPNSNSKKIFDVGIYIWECKEEFPENVEGTL